MINCNIGDTVKVHFYLTNGREEVFKISDIIPRFGFCSNGRDKVNDLLEYVENGKYNYCDISFVTQIITRGQPRVLPRNRYRLDVKLGDRNDFNGLPSRGVVAGNACEIVESAVAELDVKIDTYVNGVFVMDLLPKAWGLISINDNGQVKINVKPFRKWIRKNWSRLVETVKITNDNQTEAYKENEALYAKECRNGLFDDWKQ